MKKLVVAFLLIPVIGFSQGKLDEAKKNLSPRSNLSSSISSSSSNDDRSDDDSLFGNLLSDLFVELFLIVSYKAAFGNFEYRHFSPYPNYYDNVHGEYDFGLEKGDKRSLIRVGGNYLVGNTVNSIEANVNYRFDPFVGVELSHHSFFENGRTGSDQMDVTSLMLNYYRIRERSFTGW